MKSSKDDPCALDLEIAATIDAAAGSTAPVVICQADITWGSGFQCYPGDEFTLEDALTAMILPSSNTLAETMSRH